MKAYLALFKLKFINGLQYRAAAIAGITTQVFFGLVIIMVYLAFYQSNNLNNAPMQLSQLVSYIWLNQIFFSLTYIWQKDATLLNIIKDGNVAYELCRPINFYKKWFATMYGNLLANLILRGPLMVIIALLLPIPYRLGLPVSGTAFGLFIIAIIIASLLVTSFALLYHLVTFYSLNEKGLVEFLVITTNVFSGSFIPLAFFPHFLQKIAYLLPFQYIINLPFSIYNGTISSNQAIIGIISSIIWLLGLIIGGYILAYRATKKAIIQGG